MPASFVTRDVYVGLTEKIFGSFPMRQDQSPDGLILHTAGESPHGFYIYDVWESREHFGRFAEEKIPPRPTRYWARAQRCSPSSTRSRCWSTDAERAGRASSRA